MNIGLIVLIILVIIAILFAVLYWRIPVIRKYWKFMLVLIPGIIVIFLKMINTKKDNQEQEKELEEKMDVFKEQLTETHQKLAIEITAIKTKNKETLKKLKKVSKIKDSKVRRKQLVDLMG